MKETKQIKHINKYLSQVNVVEIYIPIEKLAKYLEFASNPELTAIWAFLKLPGSPKFYITDYTIRFKYPMSYI